VFVPVTDHVDAFLAGAAAAAGPASGPLRDRLRDHLRRAGGVAVPTDEWGPGALPPHLTMTFRVVGANRRTLAEGKDLDELRARLGVRLRDALAEAAPSIERTGLRSWTIGTLPKVVEAERGGQRLRGHPALVDEGDTVAVKLMASEHEQADAHWSGTRRLLALVLPSPIRSLLGRLTNEAKLGLLSMGYADAGGFLEDCTNAALEHLLADAGGPVWDEAAFEALQASVRARWASTVSAAVADATRVGSAVRAVRGRLARLTQPVLAPSVADIEHQLANLVYPGFVTATGLAQLAELPRYVQAVERRLDKLPADPHRDLERARRVQALERDFDAVLDLLGAGAGHAPEVIEVHWMLEELRVSLFAQQLGTPYPVSEKRARSAIEALRAG
jgi:ATP-dependent helicase HrpA